MSDKINCYILIERMKWANEVIKYLPCMKHVENSPSGWPIMNTPFSEIELCIHIINALPLDLAVAYWVSKGQHFPTCVKTLGDDLKLVEAQVKQTAKTM